MFHHSGFPQIQSLPDLVRERLFPVVKTEEQLLYVMHIAGTGLQYNWSFWQFVFELNFVSGPFLQRLHSERFMRPVFDLTVQFYRMLQKVDRESGHLRHVDAICDILYHVKYQFTGDSVRQDAERVVR